MVDPIANGADIEIPVLIVGAGPAGLSSGDGTGLGLAS
jgi:ribulose 1,5-bisphosphate synthetase/thiazole synthase